MRRTLIAPFPLLVLALVACAPDAGTATDAAAPTAAPSTTQPAATMPDASAQRTIDLSALEAHHWLLVSAMGPAGKPLEALFANPDTPLQLDFDDSRISIDNLCNHISGHVEIANGKLVMDKLTSTLMACAEPRLMAMEDKAKALLTGTLAIRLDPAKPQLVLSTSEGATLTFHGVPTAETRYGSEGEIVYLEVAAATVPCEDTAVQDGGCLKVRELHYGANGLPVGEPGPWHPLGQDIANYQHHSGIRNVLRVKRYALVNPQVEGAAVAYQLDAMIESEVVDAERSE